ncbi:MAG TPA: DUF3194 domain-containing protein [Candidatus Bathyarchaeota archaeon]|nr:DUF3194 domain-containing protein [Candidatus Bathyarchaeota archaeon]HEW89947.1 DUF3194 domain-containing protein [Candidatus Bathyarchaeota archaeon]
MPGEVTIGLPELADEQIMAVIEAGEEAAKRYVLSKLPAKKVYDIGICIQVEGNKPLTVTVDVELRVASSAKVDPDELARGAAKKAMEAIEAKLREFALASYGT